MLLTHRVGGGTANRPTAPRRRGKALLPSSYAAHSLQRQIGTLRPAPALICTKPYKTGATMRTVELHLNRAGFGDSLSEMRRWLDRDVPEQVERYGNSHIESGALGSGAESAAAGRSISWSAGGGGNCAGVCAASEPL